MAEENQQVSPIKKIKLSSSGDNELSEKILKQIEYYFSDVNIIKDKFLLEEMKKDDGWIKLSTMLKFARLTELTKDVDCIVKSLKEFDSNIVELDEEKKQIRRKQPMPDAAEFQKQLDLRTVHISGFPVDYTFEQLRRFCIQFGEVESVAMRRHYRTRFFKGCILAVFKNEADAKKVLDTELLKCKDRELQKEPMAPYYKRKAEKAAKWQERKLAGKKSAPKKTEAIKATPAAEPEALVVAPADAAGSVEVEAEAAAPAEAVAPPASH